jgi:hypothetical protein
MRTFSSHTPKASFRSASLNRENWRWDRGFQVGAKEDARANVKSSGLGRTARFALRAKGITTSAISAPA